MIKIIMIVFICLLLNNCTSYKNYKQQQQIIEKQKTWLNI
jgi:putative effector of murein hydrolase